MKNYTAQDSLDQRTQWCLAARFENVAILELQAGERVGAYSVRHQLCTYTEIASIASFSRDTLCQIIEKEFLQLRKRIHIYVFTHFCQ